MMVDKGACVSDCGRDYYADSDRKSRPCGDDPCPKSTALPFIPITLIVFSPLSLPLSLSLSLSNCISLSFSISLTVSLCFCISLFLRIYMYVSLSIYPYVCHICGI